MKIILFAVGLLCFFGAVLFEAAWPWLLLAMLLAFGALVAEVLTIPLPVPSWSEMHRRARRKSRE